MRRERRQANLMTAKDKLFFLIIGAVFVIAILVLLLPGISPEVRERTIGMIIVGYFAILRNEPLPQQQSGTDISAGTVENVNVSETGETTPAKRSGTQELNPEDAPKGEA